MLQGPRTPEFPVGTASDLLPGPMGSFSPQVSLLGVAFTALGILRGPQCVKVRVWVEPGPGTSLSHHVGLAPPRP